MTAVAGRTEMLLDQRHLDPDELAAMLAEAREACEQAAADQGCEVELRHLWSIPPIPFDDRLIDSARGRAGVGRQGHGDSERAAARRRGDGPSHPDRDDLLVLLPAGVAHEGGGHAGADLRVAIEAYGRTVDAALGRAAAGELTPYG